MKWVRKSDKFLLSRDELADLVLFAQAWGHSKKSERPVGWNEFNKKLLARASRLLTQYMRTDASFRKWMKQIHNKK